MCFVNEIIFLISISVCLLLLYKKATGLCVLLLYLENLFIVFIKSKSLISLAKTSRTITLT